MQIQINQRRRLKFKIPSAATFELDRPRRACCPLHRRGNKSLRPASTGHPAARPTLLRSPPVQAHHLSFRLPVVRGCCRIVAVGPRTCGQFIIDLSVANLLLIEVANLLLILVWPIYY